MIDRLFDRTKGAEKALDASWLRNDVIAQNISNVDTPGYKRNDVSFEEKLGEAMDKSSFKGFRTDPRHIPIGGDSVDDIDISITPDNNTLSMRLDGNNVDVDNEMANMAKNSIEYNTLIQGISAEYKKIMSAINEGRR
jgi:flagellar basal-body rod protein FlgB